MHRTEWARLRDGRRIRLGSPTWVEGDSLSGMDQRARASKRRRDERIAIALEDISALQLSQANRGATGVTILVGSLVAGSIALMACCLFGT